MSGARILVFGPHPDDIEFGCAPLLLLEAQAEPDARAQIKLVLLSRGEAGSSGNAQQREQEARAAAALLQAEIDFVDFRGDCHLDATPANAVRLAAEIRRFQPQIVLAPQPGPNQHPDHIACGTLVRDACRLARYAGLADLKALAPVRISQLYFYDITQHGLRAPDIVVDITSVVPAWEAVMRCHASQVQAKGYLDLQLAAARLLGLSIGVEYACGVYANEPVRIERLSKLTLSSRNF
ncbi:MAG: PIG-L deacetylase family protein [Terriglobales bacterium]